VSRIPTAVKPKKKNNADRYKKRNIDSQARRRHQEIAVKTIFFFTFDFLLHAWQVKEPFPHLFKTLKYGMLFFLQCGQIILLVLLSLKGTILKLFHYFFILKYESLIPKEQSDF